MARALIVIVSLLFAPLAFAAGAETPADSTRLSYGNALYYAYQGEWFEAIARLDAERARPRGLDGSASEALSSQVGPFTGWLELNYRMQQRAERVIKAMAGGAAQNPVRNEALFQLARVYFQKDRKEDAFYTVGRIHGDVPEAVRPELDFLRANIDLAVGRNVEAIALLKNLQNEKSLEGFSSYNLGIALFGNRDEQLGLESLDRTGLITSDDRATLAIKDKANLVLGERLLGKNQLDTAKEVLDRVRLDGPFSDRALLSSGWADAMQNRFKLALVPWSILSERAIADPAVQEAMLAVPYAYSRLGVYSTAARKYEEALKAFEGEIGKLDASIASIRQGAFLNSLTREELKQDANWIVKLRELPVTTETAYLLDLMASNDFQESLKNYLDLDQLRGKLETWSGDLVADEDLIRLRRAHYEPLLPGIDSEFIRIDSQMRSLTAARDRIAQQLEAMQKAPRLDLLVTADERNMSEQVARLEKLVTPRNEEGASTMCDRIRRLRGLLTWRMYAEYDKRFADARAHLRELDQELDALNRQHRSFASTRHTAIGGYQGYDDALRRLRQGIGADREKVRALIVSQGQVLETLAVNELTRRRDWLEELRVKARFALADSYDRASKARTQK